MAKTRRVVQKRTLKRRKPVNKSRRRQTGRKGGEGENVAAPTQPTDYNSRLDEIDRYTTDQLGNMHRDTIVDENERKQFDEMDVTQRNDMLDKIYRLTLKLDVLEKEYNEKLSKAETPLRWNYTKSRYDIPENEQKELDELKKKIAEMEKLQDEFYRKIPDGTPTQPPQPPQPTTTTV